MDPINSSVGMGPEMYVMKKAIDSQSQSVMKLLESIPTPQDHPSSSASELTGLGQNLDIRA